MTTYQASRSATQGEVRAALLERVADLELAPADLDRIADTVQIDRYRIQQILGAACAPLPKTDKLIILVHTLDLRLHELLTKDTHGLIPAGDFPTFEDRIARVCDLIQSRYENTKEALRSVGLKAFPRGRQSIQVTTLAALVRGSGIDADWIVTGDDFRN